MSWRVRVGIGTRGANVERVTAAHRTEEHLEDTWGEAALFVRRGWAVHGVRLPSARLPVAEDRAVVPAEDSLGDAHADVLEHVRLGGALVADGSEGEAADHWLARCAHIRPRPRDRPALCLA